MTKPIRLRRRLSHACIAFVLLGGLIGCLFGIESQEARLSGSESQAGVIEEAP